MSRSRLASVSLLLVVMLLAAACGQGDGGIIPDTPRPETVTLQGAVYVPGGPGVQPASAGFVPLALEGRTPLAGARVIALKVPELTEVAGAVAETDGEGRYTLSGVPKGISVIVVASKEIDGQTVRLSTYVANADEGAQADVDVATSLATEVLVQAIKEGDPLAPTAESFHAMVEAAEQLVSELELSLEDIFVGEGIFSEEIGDGLDPDFEGAEQIQLPVADPALFAAKMTVAALRNIGVTLAGDTSASVEQRLMRFADELSGEKAQYIGEVAVGIAQLVDLTVMLHARGPGIYEWDDDAPVPIEDETSAGDEWVLWKPFGQEFMKVEIRPYEGGAQGGGTHSGPTHTMKFFSVDREDEDVAFVMHYSVSSMLDGLVITLAMGELPNGDTFTLSFGEVDEDSVELSGEVNLFSVDVTLNGNLKVHDYLGLYEFVFDGSAPSSWSIEFTGDAQFDSFLVNGAIEMDFIGRIVGEGDDAWILPVPSRAYVDASVYERRPTGEVDFFTGRLEAVWHNAGTYDPASAPGPENPFEMELTFDGTLYTPQRPDIALSMEIASEGWGVAQADLTFAYGDQTFTGTLELNYDRPDDTMNPWDVEMLPSGLVLEYPARGVTLTLSLSPELGPGSKLGEITVAGHAGAVAEIRVAPLGGQLIVEYTNGDIETII